MISACEALDYFRRLQDRFPDGFDPPIVNDAMETAKRPPFADEKIIEPKPVEPAGECTACDRALLLAVQSINRPIANRGITQTIARSITVTNGTSNILVRANPNRRMWAYFCTATSGTPFVFPEQFGMPVYPNVTPAIFPSAIFTEEVWGAFVQLQWNGFFNAVVGDPCMIWEEIYLR